MRRANRDTVSSILALFHKAAALSPDNISSFTSVENDISMHLQHLDDEGGAKDYLVSQFRKLKNYRGEPEMLHKLSEEVAAWVDGMRSH